MRRIVTFAGWALLVLLPLAGVVVGWEILSRSHRISPIGADNPLIVLRLWLQDMIPSLILILLGLAIGGACLLLAAMDRRLERLERAR